MVVVALGIASGPMGLGSLPATALATVINVLYGGGCTDREIARGLEGEGVGPEVVAAAYREAGRSIREIVGPLRDAWGLDALGVTQALEGLATPAEVAAALLAEGFDPADVQQALVQAVSLTPAQALAIVQKPAGRGG